MSDQISKNIKIGVGLDGLEVATFFAGLLVVLGLLMESGPEAWKAAITGVWPHRAIAGNVLVTIGVFSEVAIGLFIARSSKRAQIKAVALIAELNAETERLREKNNEAQLELIQLKKAQQPRSLDHDGFVLALRGKPNGTAVLMYQPNDPEAFGFAFQLTVGLRAGGWSTTLPVPVPDDLMPPDHDKLSPEQQSFNSSLPAIVRATGMTGGISICTRSLESDYAGEGSAFDALSCALGIAQGKSGASARRIDTLPANTFWVVVGMKS